MTGWRKLQIKRTNFFFLLVLLLFLASCQKEEKIVEEKIVARVGNSELTESQLGELISFSKNKKKYRDEIIAEWVETEILFLQAEKSGLLQDSSYKELIAETSRKLAGSIYLQNYFSDLNDEMDEENLVDYYEVHKTEFTLAQDAFSYRKINIDFDSFFGTANGLKMLDEMSGGGQNNFADSLNIVSLFEKRSEISPESIVNALDTLKASEIVIIPNTEPGVVSIVQLNQKFTKGSIPDFEVIEDLVRERYRDYKRMLIYDNLIKELYSEYNVLISR